MSGYGYHWSKCQGGGTNAVLAGGGLVVGVVAIEWVATNAVAILAVTAACGALAVAAVVALMRWGDRRERRHMAERPFLVSRPEPAILTATVIPQVSQGTQAPAIENHYHIHFDPADREAARIIRTALPGLSGVIITEE